MGMRDGRTRDRKTLEAIRIHAVRHGEAARVPRTSCGRAVDALHDHEGRERQWLEHQEGNSATAVRPVLRGRPVGAGGVLDVREGQ